MSQFDPVAFLLEFGEDALLQLNRENLIDLASHLNIEMRKSLKKAEMQRILLQQLVSSGNVEEPSHEVDIDASTYSIAEDEFGGVVFKVGNETVRHRE